MLSPLISTGFQRFGFLLFFTLGASASFAGGFQSFANALEERGWHVDRDTNGDLLLFPRTDVHEPAAAMPEHNDRNLDTLAGRLAATGWQVERDADGSVVFRAADKRSELLETAVESRPIDALADLSNHLASTGWQVKRDADGSVVSRAADPHSELPETAVESRPIDRLVDLSNRLASAGWQVERNADGSFTFRAAGTTNRKSAIESGSTPHPRPERTG